MYTLKIKPDLEKTLKKLAKKNGKQVEIILKKIDEILSNPHRYKNLRAPLNDWKRVHVDKHFVLTFSVGTYQYPSIIVGNFFLFHLLMLNRQQKKDFLLFSAVVWSKLLQEGI